MPARLGAARRSVPASEPAEAERHIPLALRVGAGWTWRLFLIAALVGGVGWLLGYLSEVSIPLAIAVLLCALLSPVTNRLKKWGLPRGLAVAITVIGGFAVVAGALTLIITQIVSGSDSLVNSATQGFSKLTGWLENGPLKLNPELWQTSQLTSRVTQFLKESQSTITTYAADVGSQVGHFFAGFAIMIFSLFYFLYDGRGIFRFVTKFFPERSRGRVDAAARHGWEALGHYVRATILVALVDALGVLIGALILGVPLAPALAALVFIGAFIPLVGAFVSGFLTVLVALVALGWVQALIMLGVIILVMQVEGHLLQPFLLGRAVHLHPLAVLLSIAIGVVIAGIVGALIAVPVLAFTKSFVERILREPGPAGQLTAPRHT
ncbi:putative PurR-regulated permease PerM [Friedmanniella endophytica]|uniref:Putative PurR-regulated permease PerM n=1 Tax=Microlunatus kandeliicorticis TaxID=1759536 RepID=A0A7W3ISR4_9ACTN|nr:AI-2E family transporter [Microlunatus kandeliicorticis]MBA8794554.1 putative PurR-regulated permease PerM [Microlunatus kandeliicorticis]